MGKWQTTGIIFTSAFLCFSAYADKLSQTLPNPLTLEYALTFSEQPHPDLAYAESGLDIAKAELHQTDSINDLEVNLQAKAQWIDPSPLSPVEQTDNHRLSLLVDKTLYDFGKHDSLLLSANQELESQKYYYLSARQRRRLDIMRRYFDVLLADLMFYRYNEEMATTYIRLDRLRDRFKLGQVSELEVLEQNVKYQKIRRMRTVSRNNQRFTRTALAVAMGDDSLIADTLATPEMSSLKRKLPDVEELQRQALSHNPRILALRAQRDSMQEMLEVARQTDNPTIKAQLEANAYSRETSSSDPWRVGLILNVPLFTGGRTDANVAKQKALYYRKQTELKKAEIELRQQVLKLWLEMEAMQLKREEAYAYTDYSELYLDKNRALYEMEVAATLGDAMITITKSQYEALKADLDLTYAWSEMDTLTGNMPKQ